MKAAASIVLDALLAGQIVHLGDYKYKIEEDALYVVGIRRVGNEPEEEVLLGAGHMTVSDLLKAAKQLSEEELVLLAADTALTVMARDRCCLLKPVSGDPFAESGLR